MRAETCGYDNIESEANFSFYSPPTSMDHPTKRKRRKLRRVTRGNNGGGGRGRKIMTTEAGKYDNLETGAAFSI